MNEGKRVRQLSREEKLARETRIVFWSVIAIWLITIVAVVVAPEKPEEPEHEPPVIVETVSAEEANATVALNVDNVFPMGRKEAADPLMDEKVELAKMVWGEARGCDREGQENVVWVALNRYDNGSYGDTITDVVSAPNQFVGYSPDHPVTVEILAVVEDVVDQWLSGVDGPDYMYFTGDGKENHFREVF